jgi:3-oxoacyl-[acyl-carrier-protein] synthase III
MRYAHIVGWGKYLPSRVMTNDDIAKTVDTTDAWIRERTGIGERRIAAENESTAVLATYAAQAALDVAGVSAGQIDLIIVATATPENFFPATACAVQDALGADKAGAFDVSAACSGFVYALSMAADAIKAGSANYVLVIGAETLSRIVDWTDRNTCVLFGDGAGAVVLQASDQPGGVLSTILRSDGSGGDFLYVSANGNGPKNAIVNSQSPIVESHFVKMNGREVYKFATRVVDKTLREVMHKVGWVAAQVDIVIPHQANIRILESAMKSLGVPMEKTIVNLDRYGNTSAASIPIALAEAAETGRLRPHDKILTIGFGGGLT